MIRLEGATRTVAGGAEQLTVVDHVDLLVRAEQFAAVARPSGSATQTLLSLVAGLETATSGESPLARQRILKEQ